MKHLTSDDQRSFSRYCSFRGCELIGKRMPDTPYVSLVLPCCLRWMRQSNHLPPPQHPFGINPSLSLWKPLRAPHSPQGFHELRQGFSPPPPPTRQPPVRDKSLTQLIGVSVRRWRKISFIQRRHSWAGASAPASYLLVGISQSQLLRQSQGNGHSRESHTMFIPQPENGGDKVKLQPWEKSRSFIGSSE
jgi:hypothetical protein